jgi:DNA ligase-1
VRLSEAVSGATWADLGTRREESRARHVEGLMLKRWSSPYRPGRKRGDWWKWKIEPFTMDAVLIYAQPGTGRRASLFTDYTFGVWDEGELVPVAKAYSGLSDQEIDELDRWVRRHTTERFGPVSAVEPVHVFELGFERLAPSTRHRSGIAVRFPRILRWRRDKAPTEADTLDMLRRLIPS